MKKLAFYTVGFCLLAGASSASALNVEYMVNPTDAAHEISVEVTQTGTDENTCH